MSKVPPAGRIAAWTLLLSILMTIAIPIERRRHAFAVGHEAVCMLCGHGESLHPQRDLACLACDQRASVGLTSHFCTGFLSDRVTAAAH